MADNKIIIENQKEGTPRSVWDAEISDQIEGFATNFSVDNGSTVDFKINVNAAADVDVPYRIEIYRLGYYGGDGATLVTTIATTGQAQPDPITDSRGVVDAGNWSVSASWDTPEDAVSGVYLAKLQRLDSNGDPISGDTNQIPFIVREDELRTDGTKSDIVLQTSDTTWQAYNGWGGNNGQVAGNFYGGFDQPDDLTSDPGPFAQDRAFAVSYNRPFLTRDGGGAAAGAQDYLFGADYAAVYWLEKNGYDVSYISGVDTDRLGADYLEGHKAYISVGHDEYWSGDQRANVEAARDAGVNLLFWSGNEVYWKTRWETSIVDGVEYRTLVCYKETWANGTIDAGPADYANIDPSSEWTGTWRDLRFVGAVDAQGNPTATGQEPENSLTGQLFGPDGTGEPGGALDIPAQLAGLRLWRDTGIDPGGAQDLATGIIGYEWDVVPEDQYRPAGLIELSETTLDWSAILTDQGNRVAPGTATHSLSLYRAPSGALVFGAGTVFWSWGLSDEHDSSPYTAEIANEAIQQLTVNIFADMGIQPGDDADGLIDAILASQGLVRAVASTDNVAAVTTMADIPDSVAARQTVTITGTATDDDGVAATQDGKVAVVEVSVDGGATWRVAQGTAAWSYAWHPTAEGSYQIQARAIDDSLNITGITPSEDTVVVTAAVPPDTFSLFDPATPITPTSQTDGQPVELGMKFRVDRAGAITELRYYRASGDTDDTDVREGHLWRADGALLATVTFSSEPGESGWQVATLSNPVGIHAGTEYVVSYRTADNYVATNGFFGPANEVAFDGVDDDAFTDPFGVVSAPQSAVVTGVGGNGVYAYGSDVVLPISTFQATNYWVDVSFDPSEGPNTAPTITSGNFSIPENQTAVGTVTATDPDGDAIVFSIAGGVDADRFAINATTGALNFLAPPDFEAPADSGTNNIFDVTIRATDALGASADQGIQVGVTDVPEAPDGLASFDGRSIRADYIFGASAAAVYPGAGATQTATVDAGTVEFVDLPFAGPDVGNGEFGLASVDIAAATIRIEFPVDPTVFPVAFLRFALATTHPFNGVQLTDADNQLPSILGVTITGQQGFTDQAGASVVLDQSNLSFNANDLFLNVAGLGRTVDIDAATSGAQPSYVTLSVDLNDAPSLASSGGDGDTAAITVAENATLVTILTAIDPDAGQSASFTVVDGEDAALFEIVGGELRFIVAPDAENPADGGATPGLQVIVRASDGFGGLDSQAISISVGDVNEFPVSAPTDADGAADTVAENAAIGALVGVTAHASDLDATTNTVVYSLLDNAGGRFAIDAATGVVSVAGALDREAAASHEINARATSADGSTADNAFIIAVSDVDEFPVSAPTDTDGAANTVAENAAIGALVGVTAHSSDLDATTNAVVYSLLDDAGGRFAIDAATGVVSVAGALDLEAAASHEINARATSADGSTADNAFIIAVSDVDEVLPIFTGVTESPAAGKLGIGKTVTFTSAISETVTVTGTPTLALSSGGFASYSSGSGTGALTFTYIVAAGQNTAALVATSVALNGATITDASGNALDLSLSGLAQVGPEIDTTAPQVAAIIETPATGALGVGAKVAITLAASEALMGSGGTGPTLTLNNGGVATYNVHTSTSTSAVFDYTVKPGQNTPALAVTAINLNGATVSDVADNAPDLSLAGLAQAGPEIDTLAPTLTALTESPAGGILGVGATVTLALAPSESVLVTGTPTLTLNDGGVATYDAAASTETSLVFDYTVLAGQSTASLAAATVNLNGGTIEDAAGNATNLSLAGLAQAGPEIDTTAPQVAAIIETPATGVLGVGAKVVITLAASEALMGSGGTGPTLTLNNGGVAAYNAHTSTSTSAVFDYTVRAGQDTTSLAVVSINLNGATVSDVAGNAPDLSLSGLVQVGPQIDTGAFTVSDAELLELAGAFSYDGNSDILFQHTDGSVEFWEMDGTDVIGGPAASVAGADAGWLVV